MENSVVEIQSYVITPLIVYALSSPYILKWIIMLLEEKSTLL
jgi:hypothetical protein